MWNVRPKGEVKDDCKESGLSNWMVVSFSLMENTGGVGLGEEHQCCILAMLSCSSL